MDWPRLGAVLHTTGLWGRSYLGVGRRAASRTWQKLCHREDTGLPWGKPYRWRIHIWDYPKGNQAIRTPSPVQGLTGDPGELTPVLGLASDCSAQSDCRGCLEDSTRVHRPGNWTGGEKGARIPGWGGMAQQAWHRPILVLFCWPPARCSRLPGQAWPSALGPVRRWRQHPRGAAPPHLHPPRTWTHPPMLRSTSYLQMAHRMKCWAPRGTDQRNHPGTGRDVRCVRSKRSVGACPAERLLQ